MSTAKSGDTVRIHYTGTLTDGAVFDSSEGRDPLEFAIGSGMIIPGLDVAMPGMGIGDKKRVEIPFDQAYGPINDDARQTIERSNIPDHIPLENGTQLQMQSPQGRAVMVTVADLTDTHVTLDANHALAGIDLIFDVEMVAIDPS